jgi:hypothetical protein
MARNTMHFAQQNTEQAVQATNWVREIAEQNLNQSKVALEGFLTIARNAARSIDRQSSAICEHSIAVAEQMLSNAFVCARKVIHVREPQELAQIQTEFVSRQAQVLELGQKMLGQKMMQGAQDIANATEEGTAESRRRSEAA